MLKDMKNMLPMLTAFAAMGQETYRNPSSSFTIRNEDATMGSAVYNWKPDNSPKHKSPLTKKQVKGRLKRKLQKKSRKINR